MEEHPKHWKATLLGEEFWKDAHAWNQPIHESIDSNIDNPQETPLHQRFPFNLLEAGPVPPSSNSSSGNEPILAGQRSRRRRRFSVDASSLTPIAPARVLELSRRTRSQSRSRSRSHTRSDSMARSPSITSLSSQSNSRLRCMLNRLTSWWKDRPAPLPLIFEDQATPESPLMDFRGGATWDRLSSDRRVLGIDVFWPVDFDDEDAEGQKPELAMLEVNQLAPLCIFHHLHSLKITGMMQSYQKYIWQAAWINTELEELELGMVFPPRIIKSNTGNWPYIKGGWKLSEIQEAEPIYHGDGTGTLDPNLGQGEYLDKMMIEKSKILAMSTNSTRHRLSIKVLTLTGFVVDADPFLHWFDPFRFKTIHFKDYCVDAGFYLPEEMSGVSVDFSPEVQERATTGRRVDLVEEMKILDLKDGKVVRRRDFGQGQQSQTQTHSKSTHPKSASWGCQVE